MLNTSPVLWTWAEVGSGGYYRSSSLSSDYSLFAWLVYFDSDNVRRMDYFSRHLGLSVRPVSE